MDTDSVADDRAVPTQSAGLDVSRHRLLPGVTRVPLAPLVASDDQRSRTHEPRRSGSVPSFTIARRTLAAAAASK